MPADSSHSSHSSPGVTAACLSPTAPRLSLKGRALMLLARREHSRMELRARLMPLARADDAHCAGAGAEACVDALLDWLAAHGHLSEQRFVEGRVRVRAHRYGNLRIHQELARHGLTLSPEAAGELRDSEQDRARQAWARKFTHPPRDAHERARQARFLLNRGFSPDVIRRVLKGLPTEAEASDPGHPGHGWTGD